MTASEPSPIEQLLGTRYQIIRQLGAGAFGTVYLARERQLYRLVTIKVVHQDRAWSDAERARLLAEARTIANLSHPAIVQLLAFEETTDAVYMVMPFIPGVTLHELLESGERFDADDVRRILIEIADALAYAHGEGVLHRDLKPENVLLERAGAINDPTPARVRLIDFGVAVFPGRDHGVDVKQELWGTPSFMSPEQLLGENTLDPRSEIYSLGVLAYLLASGRMPFDAAAPAERLRQQQAGPAVPLGKCAPAAPRDLVRTIEKCLAFNPKERWSRVRDVRDALVRGAESSIGTLHGIATIRQRLRPRRSALERFAQRRSRASAPVSTSWIEQRFGLGGLLRDFSFAIRQLRKRPLFTAAAIITLALGIGATTAVYTAVNAVLLRPLPLPGLDRVTIIREDIPRRGFADADLDPFETIALMHRTDLFAAVGGYYGTHDVIARGLGDARPLSGARVIGDLFGVFGVKPLAGRFFHGPDFEPGHQQVAVISSDVWNALGNDRSIVGRTVDLSGTSFMVIGVAPPTFHYPRGVQYWQPFPISSVSRGYVGRHAMTTLARLQPEITTGRVDAALPAVVRELHPDFALSSARLRVHGFVETFAGSLGPVLQALFAAVMFVLLITCANIGSLHFVHLTSRANELAVRTAFGASRAVLIRQLVLESAVIAVAGGMSGVLLGGAVLRAFALTGDVTVPALANLRLDARVLTVAIAASGGCALLFGVIPALRSTRIDLRETLAESSRSVLFARRRYFVLRAAVVLQVAVALVLAVGATLMIRTVETVLARSAGFDTNVRSLRVDLSNARPDTYRLLSADLATLPGFERVGFASQLPFSGIPDLDYVRIAHSDIPAIGDSARADIEAIAGDYFGSMRIPLLAGRDFSTADNASAPRVAIVDEPFVRNVLHGARALGVRLDEPNGPVTIVGVVGGVTRAELGEPVRSATIYYPYDQRRLSDGLYVTVRTRLPISTVRNAVRTAARSTDAGVVVYNEEVLAHRMDAALAPQRLATAVLAAFGALALLLATIGLYAVMSYIVSQRRSEFGIRMALGGRQSDVLRLVLGEGAFVGILGVALGMAMATIATPALRALLYGVSSHDAATFAGVAAVLTVIVLAAGYLPARRATLVDPANAIRGR
jgi:putative ABC transport system permease protein